MTHRSDKDTSLFDAVFNQAGAFDIERGAFLIDQLHSNHKSFATYISNKIRLKLGQSFEEICTNDR